MGAKNCPETPRQQMIGMMYLVLTAMLALNVSKDILEAFNVVDDSLYQSKISVAETMKQQYLGLKETDDPKFDEAKVKAAKLQQYTDSMVYYIEDLRFRMVAKVDKYSPEKINELKKEAQKNGMKVPYVPVKDIEGKDNFDIPTYFMLGDNEGKDPKCEAQKLKSKLNEYKKNILSLVENEKDRKKLEDKLFKLEDHKGDPKKKDDPKKTWEVYNFDHLIAGGTVILFNKMISEVKNAEATLFEEITNVGKKEFKISAFEGHAIAESKVLFTGEKFKANVIIAAFDPTIDLDVYYKVGADTLRMADEATATHLTGKGNGVPMELDGHLGENKFAGIIKIAAPDGKGDGDGYKRFYFRDSFTVIQKGGATISADKMNVLYAGIPNPMTAAGGSDASKLNAVFQGCNSKPLGGGKYEVTPPATMIGKTVTATVTTSDGNSVQQTFRVKKVPDPTSYLGANIWGGKRSKTELLANPFISARMGDDFAFDLKWTVNSYRMVVISKGIEGAPISCSGGAFSGQVTSAINSASTGTVIIFQDIKVSSIAGQRTLRDITVRIK